MGSASKQIVALLSVSGAYFRRRPGAALVIITGIACTVGVFVSMLSMSAGVAQSIGEHTDPDRAFVLSSRSPWVLNSFIPRTDAASIENAPPIARGLDGAPLSSGVALVLLQARARRDYSSVSFSLSDVESSYFRLYPDIHLTAGRMFRPGEHELIVSDRESAQLLGLAVGDHIRLRGNPWTVVGHFKASASAVTPAIADATTLDSALSSNGFQYIVARIASRRALDQLRRLTRDGPSVSLQVQPEGAVIRAEYGSLTRSLTVVSYFVGLIMAAGASLGAVATMHVLMEARRRDVATLRALGFRNEAISVGLLIEAIALAVLGSAVGCTVAWLFFDGAHAEALGSSIVMTVTAPVALIGTTCAVAIGLIAGIAAAVSGTRRSVAQALQGR